MSKEMMFGLLCILLGVGGYAGKMLYQANQDAEAKRIEEVRKAALADAMTQLRSEAAKAAAAATPAPAVKPTASAAAAPAKPVAPAGPSDDDVKGFLSSAKISSTLMGVPPLVVINKKSYEEGSEIPLASGNLKIARITDDGVKFSTASGKTYNLARR